jgi:heterodisulfide reductase subunit C
MTTPSEQAALYWTGEALDLDFMEELGPAAEDLVRCADCGSCTASCPTANRMAVVSHLLGRLIRLGLKQEALESQSFWQCTSCAACSLHCPRGMTFSG